MLGNPASRCWGGCWPRLLYGGGRANEGERERKGSARLPHTQCVRATCSVLDSEADRVSGGRSVSAIGRKVPARPAGRLLTPGAGANFLQFHFQHFCVPGLRPPQPPSPSPPPDCSSAEDAVGTPVLTATFDGVAVSDRPLSSPDGCSPGSVTPLTPRRRRRTSALVTTVILDRNC